MCALLQTPSLRLLLLLLSLMMHVPRAAPDSGAQAAVAASVDSCNGAQMTVLLSSSSSSRGDPLFFSPGCLLLTLLPILSARDNRRRLCVCVCVVKTAIRWPTEGHERESKVASCLFILSLSFSLPSLSAVCIANARRFLFPTRLFSPRSHRGCPHVPGGAAAAVSAALGHRSSPPPTPND